MSDTVSTPPFSRLGIVVGMEAEASLIRPFLPHARIGLSGATLSGARQAVLDLLEGGVDALLSFGLAAGLDPALPPGTVVIPRHVMVNGERLAAAPSLLAWLGAERPDVTGGDLLHSDVIVTAARRKTDLFSQTGCVALDMESGVVAEMASMRKVPFAALRVICDPADRTLPPAAVVALRPDGSLAVGALIRSILCDPLQIPALIRVGRDAGQARTAARTVLAHRFG
ncbi:purine phosphorylase [Komagataeibacter kakiaceti JCM 25156]